MSSDPKSSDRDHPRQVYQTPSNIVAAEDLTSDQKIEMLEYWETDLIAKLRAESEGMGASEPVEAEEERDLAEEQRLVHEALTELRQG